MLLLVLPWLVPMSRYISQAEQIAASELGVPVAIGSMRIALLPSPRLKVSDIVIGQDELLSAEQVVVVPALASVLSDTKVLSRVTIVRPVIRQGALDLLMKLSANKVAAAQIPLSVRHVILQHATMDWPKLHLPAWNADLTLNAANIPESAYIETVDGKLKAVLKPADGYQSLIVNAEHWTIPVGPPLQMDELKADMLLYADRLEIKRFHASLYQGQVGGSAHVSWKKNWRIDGKIDVAGLAVQKPASLISHTTRVSGALFGRGSFNAGAKQPALLADRLNADFRFKVENGVLYGVDLAKAASLLLRQGQKGGETRFDALSGVLKAKGKHYQFRDLKVSSGLIDANGFVKINPEKQLDGVVDVELKRSMSLASIPLQVSGTLNDPVVMPTKAAMAGAVAGTAIMGPGVGTSLGIKAGDAIGKLKGWFGGSDE